jgi:hypothetical protein
MVARAIHKTDNQRRQLVVTNSVVLAAFLPRCVFVLFVATSNFNNDVVEGCGFCGKCQTIGRVLAEYLNVRPEFYASVAWIRSALPIVVCLWGMLSGSDRRACHSPRPRTLKQLIVASFQVCYARMSH